MNKQTEKTTGGMWELVRVTEPKLIHLAVAYALNFRPEPVIETHYNNVQKKSSFTLAHYH